MIIRKARKKDVDQIYLVFKDYDEALVRYLPPIIRHMRKNKKKPVIKNCKKDILKDILERNSVFFVAEEQGMIVGYIHGSVNRKPHAIFKFVLKGRLDDIAVRKSYRGKGVASALWKEMLKWFKENKCGILELQTILGNPAIKIYEKWGFKKTKLIMNKKI